MPEPHEESVSVFDPEGRVVGALPRAQAKRSRLAVGAVNVLLVSARGEVLLQRRPEDKENGGRWDKTVGGHVDEGETFDEAAVREAGEELFGDGTSPRVRLARDEAELGRLLASADLSRQVVFRRAALQLNLRDVRLGPGGSGIRNVIYHVTSYLGRTDVPLDGFRPQKEEIAGLRYAAPAEVDALLVRGELAPNMAFLWLTHAQALLALAGPAVTGWEDLARALSAHCAPARSWRRPARGGGARPAGRGAGRPGAALHPARGAREGPVVGAHGLPRGAERAPRRRPRGDRRAGDPRGDGPRPGAGTASGSGPSTRWWRSPAGGRWTS